MQYALVMDTCGGEGYVAVCEAGTQTAAVLAERHLPARGTQEHLLPLIQDVLMQAGVSLSAIAAVAVVGGPGSFTGVRIGLATAKGLCEAQGLRLIVLSRLAVLAQAARLEIGPIAEPIHAWLDAGRGDVYAVVLQADGQTLGTEFMLSAREAALQATNGQIAMYEESLHPVAPLARLVSPVSFAASLRMAAASAVRSGRWADPALSDAHYLRIPDAELALRARLP